MSIKMKNPLILNPHIQLNDVEKIWSFNTIFGF